MKRSEINRIIHQADAFIHQRGFYLPPFAYWTPQDWLEKGPEARQIVENHLGWDITDFGLGDFKKQGLFLFTIRNGSPDNLAQQKGKLYAEKLLIVDPEQITPLHFHWNKMEDIINRGGGRLVIQLFNASPEEELDRETPVTLILDGVEHTYPAGSQAVLMPGESITLPPYCYHKFWAEGERVLVGEVSVVNDDERDNRFCQPIGRFPVIEEDEPPVHLLVGDYGRYYQPKN